MTLRPTPAAPSGRRLFEYRHGRIRIFRGMSPTMIGATKTHLQFPPIAPIDVQGEIGKRWVKTLTTTVRTPFAVSEAGEGKIIYEGLTGHASRLSFIQEDRDRASKSGAR